MFNKKELKDLKEVLKYYIDKLDEDANTFYITDTMKAQLVEEREKASELLTKCTSILKTVE